MDDATGLHRVPAPPTLTARVVFTPHDGRMTRRPQLSASPPSHREGDEMRADHEGQDFGAGRADGRPDLDALGRPTRTRRVHAGSRGGLDHTTCPSAGPQARPDQEALDRLAGSATVLILNDSPDPLSIVFSGPEVLVEDIDACLDCIRYTGDGPPECPNLGPVAEHVLAPGTYEVVVRSRASVLTTPSRGTWILDGGQLYEHCFYIVTR
jgi:hypothetical protein